MQIDLTQGYYERHEKDQLFACHVDCDDLHGARNSQPCKPTDRNSDGPETPLH
jgi:hypothetical protein